MLSGALFCNQRGRLSGPMIRAASSPAKGGRFSIPEVGVSGLTITTSFYVLDAPVKPGHDDMGEACASQ